VVDLTVGSTPEIAIFYIIDARIASLTLVYPLPREAGVLAPLASRLLVFRGESDRYAATGGLVKSLPGTRLVVVHNDVA
jgi:hypothetical protein